MSRRRSTSRSAACALLVAAASAFAPEARAQSCCAGGSAVTPGRLAMHEDALVGVRARVALGTGSFGDDGAHRGNPDGASELELGQDLFGALRLARRAQAALLVPFVETRRTARGASEMSGGLGDIELSGRYDFLLAGEHAIVPGVAMLAGLTAPTGTPPERATRPLATDATGTGAAQGSLGLALEQSYARWLVSLIGLAAVRAPRTANGVETALAPQWSALAAVAYTLTDEAAVALLASATFEGSKDVNGVTAPASAQRRTSVGVSGVLPLGTTFRLRGAVTVDPPIDGLGRNMPSQVVGQLTLVRSFM